jgi:hypothetical protein
MGPADERPRVGVQGCLNRPQIENSCVRVMDHGFMFDERVVTDTKHHGCVRV